MRTEPWAALKSSRTSRYLGYAILLWLISIGDRACCVAEELSLGRTPQSWHSTNTLRRPFLCRLRGGGRKGKENKHSKAELAAKLKAATQNKGGGKEGLKDRKGGEAGHSKFECKVCGVRSPSIASLKIHHEAKHPKIRFDPDAFAENVHEKFGGTTKGLAVQGTQKNAKKKKKEKKGKES
mmetsp:Transcript_22153/g.31017  ORF Transcript_22153/g.31017 Transcript_22153/m.31017 type:complete len:181 (+) Transcript_22153:203-745(+)|eukprot:CAMPEP_0185271212 /NCGR_PEP_ID=MMETSP1359-20130426/44214_1 /TAXON_ID=552665 /ORGANISM="Bigelowiella longifila, Strain CCMP242" /LENGTH=180 /DNA_ID=CAMNT_0027863077 /DNA_START=61 /DNA_END=603 /DNA_ORIENTATION=-